jgi:LPS-assembly protein
MRNNFIIFLFSLFFYHQSFADNIFIEAKNISLNKQEMTSIFENDVIVKTKNKIINSDYAKYNKNTGLLIIKNNIKAIDEKNNVIETNYAEYNEFSELFKSKGSTFLKTSEGYILEGENIIIDNNKKIINSKSKAILKDLDGNKVFLENFEYLIQNNIFKSIGLIEIEDKAENTYEFSQIYIDTKKKEILGTDIKAFLNQQDFKINEENDPRLFANSANIGKDQSSFNKTVFTLCKYKKNDKCPPWTIQSKKMLHDNKKKTIYYDNAVVKVYDIPIFYFPKLSHPDPSVARRSGFLPPTIYDSKNLGSGISIPYFFDLGIDKNLTVSSRLYGSENPLFLGEFHQAFENSNFLSDFGFTEGYKKTSSTKQAGEKSHIFTKFVKNFKGEKNSDNSIDLSLQEISNDKYLKLYKIESNLVDYNIDTLENSFGYTHENDDTFFNFKASAYETLKDDYEDKYEYILPEVTLDKNLLNNEQIGNINLQTNVKVRNYDTNKLTNFIVNDFNWDSKDLFFKSGINSKFLGNIKNINYEAKNVDIYKDKKTSEVYGTLGLLSKMDLQKQLPGSKHTLTPKMLIRYSPGNMRKETEGDRLTPSNAYNLSRLTNINNNETGLNSTLGFDYKINKKNSEFDFSIAQIINEKENKNMSDKSSLNEKLSDLVGKSSYKLNENFKLNYNFSIDQNYNDFNYNEIGTTIGYGQMEIDFNYLQENKHIGKQDYLSTKVDINNKENSLVSFETKRNLLTNSSEFYNLSYEYFNDCLKAGLVYRREFYKDTELEPEDSLMFKITLIPFGNLNSPKLSQ